MLTRQQIEDQLRAELELARVTYVKAREEFDMVTKEPTGLLHPDGVLKIEQVGTAHTFAMRAYREVLKEFNQLCISGKIPERLKQEPESSS